MSVVNKIEKTYLDILRVVVLTVASLLLIVAIVAGILGFSGTVGHSEKLVSPRKVVTDEVINKMKPPLGDAANSTIKTPEEKPADDLYKNQYQKIVDSLDLFVKNYAGVMESVDKKKAMVYVASLANQFENEETKSDYVTGMVDTVEKALKSDTVIARVKKNPKDKITAPPVDPVQPVFNENGELVVPPAIVESPFKESPVAVSTEVISQYTELFNKNIAEAAAENNRNEMGKAENTAAAMMKLYISGGAFLAFILVIFISVLVKIERNLRLMAEKP